MSKQSDFKTFPQWLAFAIAGVDKTKLDGSPAACVALSLNHVSQGIEKEIHGIPLVGRKFDDAGIVALADMLHGLAETDAQNLSGKQQYVVYAFYEDGEAKPKARFPLSVNGHIVNKPGDLSTEPPTVEGRMQQRMRHDEGYSQMLVMATANLMSAQNQFIKIQADRLAETARENRDLVDTVHRTLFEKLQYDREHELKKLEYERNTKIMQGLTKFAPAMLNTITGKEIVPQSTVDTAILETLADVLDEKTMVQAAPLLSKLPPEMVGVLMSRLEQIQKAKTEGEERLTKALESGDSKAMARAELGNGAVQEDETGNPFGRH